MGKDEVDKDKSLLEELKKIRQRINNGEKFENVVKGYRDNEKFGIQDTPRKVSPRSWEAGGYKRQGTDALVPWENLDGKAVLLSFQDIAFFVWVIDDYTPSTRTTTAEALSSNKNNLREEALERVRSYKKGKALKKLIKKIESEVVVYADDKEKLFQKLADDYESWFSETYKDAPDFQQRLKNLRQDKVKYFERKKRKEGKAKSN